MMGGLNDVYGAAVGVVGRDQKPRRTVADPAIAENPNERALQLIRRVFGAAHAARGAVEFLNDPEVRAVLQEHGRPLIDVEIENGPSRNAEPKTDRDNASCAGARD